MRGTTRTHTSTFSYCVTTFARSIGRILKQMWDMAVRHRFGAVRVDNDAAEERLVAREEGADEAYADVTDDENTELLFPETHHAIDNSISSSPPTTSLWATAAEHLHAPANSPHAPVNRVIGDPDYFTRSSDSDGCPSLMEDPSDNSKDVDMMPPREVQQPHFGEPFLTLTLEENAAMAAMVAGVKKKLVRLKDFTPDKMPAYHHDVQHKSYAQVLKSRLEAIARSLNFGKQISEEQHLTTELKVCRHIATEYWPLPVTPTTHLDIHRIYRNALFCQTATDQLRQDHTNCWTWVEEVVETRRPAMSFGEAASRFAGAQQAQQDIVDATEAESKASRLRQEEEDRKEAERLDRELNQPESGVGESAYSPSYKRGEAAEIAAQVLLNGCGQDANAGAQTQVASDHRGAELESHRRFASDEEYARYLQDQENAYHDDMPGLIPGDLYDAREIQRERDEQAAKDHALAIQLDEEDREPPIIDLGRARSQTAKATEANTEDAETQGIAGNFNGTALIEHPPPIPFSRYSLPRPLMTIPEYQDGACREVGDSDDDDRHTALMADSPPLSPATSPTPRYGGQKRKERESEEDTSGYQEKIWED